MNTEFCSEPNLGRTRLAANWEKKDITFNHAVLASSTLSRNLPSVSKLFVTWILGFILFYFHNSISNVAGKVMSCSFKCLL